MYPYTSLLAAAILSFVLSTTICPFGKKLFKRDPRASQSTSDLRQMHDNYIPRIGGLGIVVGFWLTTSLVIFLGTGLGNNVFLVDARISRLYLVAGISISAFVLGFLDDIFDIRARYKLLAQVVIATITSIYIIPIDKIGIPFLGDIHLGNIGVIFTVIWIVGVMNAFNLIDGLDSLAGGIALIAIAAYSIQAWLTNDFMFFTLGIVLIGAIAGFLIYNFYPAKVFMGDGGALFLGYLLAVLPLIQIKATQGSWSISPVFLLGVPLVDTLFSMLRRFIRGISLFAADRNHIHHKLIAKGLSHRQAVRRLHFVSILYAIIYIVCLQDIIQIKLGLIAFFSISWLLVFYAGYEELNRPMKIIRDRNNGTEDRSFVYDLSLRIELFFKQARTFQELLFVLKTWSLHFGAYSVTIGIGGKTISKIVHRQPPTDSEIKKLDFQQNDICIELVFLSGLFELDSDTKLKCIQHVMTQCLQYLPNLTKEKSAPQSNVVNLYE